MSVNPKDGSVWIAERDHPDVANSKNRLWLRNADGSVRHQLDLSERDIFIVECIPSSGDALFGGFSSGIRRATKDGQLSDYSKLEVRNIAVSPTTGEIWVTTEDAVLRLDEEGKEHVKTKLAGPSGQSWIAAF